MSSYDPEFVAYGDIVLDMGKLTITQRHNGVSCHVTPNPAKLLQKLMLKPGRVVRRETLIETVWTGADGGPDTQVNICSVMVHNLRVALKKIASTVRIETVPSAGYSLEGGEQMVVRVLTKAQARMVDAFLGSAADAAPGEHTGRKASPRAYTSPG